MCLLPLLAGALLLLSGGRLRRVAGSLTVGAFGGALGLAGWVAVMGWQSVPHGSESGWFRVGDTSFSAGVWLDHLSMSLLVVVPLVALPVAVFAARYLRDEVRYATFFGQLNLFVAAMLGLLLARDLLAATLCWELVGFTSYLLIGFWFTKPEAATAARQAFLLNRLGDLGLFVALGSLLAAAGTLDLPTLLVQAPALLAAHPPLLALAGAGLLWAAVAKSAQWPLTPWLPAAMEGPTPVSALLHAATLVAAGAYLLLRVYPLLPPVVLTTAAGIGAFTAVWSAVAALGQTDSKRVLAYSTASQLGYVLLGVGTGAPVAAALHLLAHAFFKASLFLNVGVVTHAAGHAIPEGADFDPQDLRRLGGLRRALPVTFAAYALAAAALVGLPLTTGFLTKEGILAGAVMWANKAGSGLHLRWLVPDAALLTVLLTAAYMARHGRLIFLDAPRGPYRLAQVRAAGGRAEAPAVLLVPVVGLALLALWPWLSRSPLHVSPGAWLPAGLVRTVGGALAANVAWLPWASMLLLASGVVLSARVPVAGWPAAARPERWLGALWFAWGPRAALRLARAVAEFDATGVDRLVVRAGKGVVVTAKLTGWLDRWLIDGLVDGLGRALTGLARLARAARGGGVQTYFRWVVAVGLGAAGWLLTR